MESPDFHRLYLTKIMKKYECDTFFPPIPSDLERLEEPEVPKGIQKENDISYEYYVYGKKE